MELLFNMPIWALALAIFLFRIIDVSLGTLRTIAVVQGHLVQSVLIGFFEILIWVTAISQVIVSIQESPLLLLAFAGGFAVGNACGIYLERRIALGRCIVRMITSREGDTIADRVRALGHELTSFAGKGPEGARTLMFTTCSRREVPAIIGAAAALDPNLFYTVDRFSQSGTVSPFPHPTGWRAVLKKK